MLLGTMTGLQMLTTGSMGFTFLLARFSQPRRDNAQRLTKNRALTLVFPLVQWEWRRLCVSKKENGIARAQEV